MNWIGRFLVLAVLLPIAGLVGCGGNHLGHAAYVTLGSANDIAGYGINSSGR
jgi:hypothetical protein